MHKIMSEKIYLNGIPDKKTTIKPAAMTRSEVPRSGCLAINRPGIITRTIMTINSLPVGGNLFSWRYHAIIMGTESFIISDG